MKLPFKKLSAMNKEEKTIFWQRVQLYGGAVLLVAALAIFLNWYNTRQITQQGILPTPRKVVEPLPVVYMAQDDPLWANDPLAETGYTMEEEGSIFACLSMVLAQNEGIEVTPGELNQAFLEGGLYVDGKAANVAELDKLYPDADFYAPRDFNGEDMTKQLKNGKACMVRVLRGENVHWLCVVGADEEDFLVYDPLKGDELQHLADYEKVYALGLIK